MKNLKLIQQGNLSLVREIEKEMTSVLYFNMIDSIENEKDENELERLSSHKKSSIRLLVARNEFTNLKTLKFLSYDESEDVRREVRNNKNFVSEKISQNSSKRNLITDFLRIVFFIDIINNRKILN